MKKFHIVSLFLFVLISIFAFGVVKSVLTVGSVNFTVTTANHGGQYSPKNIVAIWITNSSNQFVKSLKVMAQYRKQYLYTWNTSSGGNVTDAIVGATLTSAQTHNVTWNCKDVNGNTVPDGDYKMNIEFTDFHGQGPLATFTFTKSGTSFQLNPADMTYFKSIALSYMPSSTAIFGSRENELKFQLFPNPVKTNEMLHIKMFDETEISVSIYNSSGQIIYDRILEKTKSSEREMTWNLCDSKGNLVAPGVYFVRISNKNSSTTEKIFIKN